MKQFKDKVIIGIDHGYGNIKTADHVFKTGVPDAEQYVSLVQKRRTV